MKKNNSLHAILLVSLTVFMVSCSSTTEDFKQEKAESNTSQKIRTTFDEDSFVRNLNNVTALFSTQRRTAEIDEETATTAIEPFIEDGKYIQEQLLDDRTLTVEEREEIENITDENLAALSIIAYEIITADEIDERLMNSNEEYQRKVDKKLHCLSVALVGGGSISGGLTWGLIKKLGTRTAVRLAASALGGMVGGAITIAFYINDYNDCMNKQ